jgi:hypothetical protein
MSQPPDPFEFLKTLWGPMGLPLPGPLGLGLDRSEVDKRIAELRSVESWLGMNLSVLRATLHGLEMQKAALAAMQGTASAATAPDVPESSPRAPAAAVGVGPAAAKQQTSPRPARRSRK